MSVYRRAKWLLEWAAITVSLYLPCRFLLPLRASYFIDWGNHEWAIGYFGAYFRANLRIPAAFNTAQVGGIAGPVFYGTLFYPLMGLPASVLAPGVVIRLAAVAIFAAQFFLVSKSLVMGRVPRYLAAIVACLVVWAVYPLTNLYNRGALTEFFATSLLVCAAACLVLLFLADDHAQRRRYASGTMLSLTIAAGTHPITAMYSAPVFLVFGCLLLYVLCRDFAQRKSVLRSLAPWTVPAVLCLLPWYVVVAEYSNSLRLHGAAVTLFQDDIDNWKTRFFPIAWDSRVHDIKSFNPALTPYLDAQISMPLLLLFLGLAAAAVARSRRGGKGGRSLVVAAASGTMFVVFTWLSLSRTPYEWLPAKAQMIQFAYRAVTYQNLALLVGVMLLLITAKRGSAKQVPSGRWLPAVATASALLGAMGVVIKWSHISAIRQDTDSPHVLSDRHEREAFIDLPPQYYGVTDYSTSVLFEPLPVERLPELKNQQLLFDSGSRFGRPRITPLILDKPTWIRTNVQAFPWNVIVVDGDQIPASDLRVHEEQLVVAIPAGTHRITTRFRPPSWWQIAHTISLLTLIAWFGYVFASSLLRWWRALSAKLRSRITESNTTRDGVGG